MLSSKSRYAFRALVFLALKDKEEGKIGINYISSSLDIPKPFLAKIMQDLARMKVLNSLKGPRGGFSMAKPANEIRLVEILEIIEGSDFFDRCLIGISSCTEGEIRCPFFTRYDKIRKQLKELFENSTIQNLVDEIKTCNGNFNV